MTSRVWTFTSCKKIHFSYIAKCLREGPTLRLFYFRKLQKLTFDLIKNKTMILYWTIWLTKRETKPEERRQEHVRVSKRLSQWILVAIAIYVGLALCEGSSVEMRSEMTLAMGLPCLPLWIINKPYQGGFRKPLNPLAYAPAVTQKHFAGAETVQS